MRAVCWATGEPLQEYGYTTIEIADPTKCPMVQSFEFNPELPYGGDLVLTMDKARALTWIDAAEALEFWKRQSPFVSIRPDGEPNRPMTALTVTVETVQ